jgi:hypothetical protein
MALIEHDDRYHKGYAGTMDGTPIDELGCSLEESLKVTKSG